MLYSYMFEAENKHDHFVIHLFFQEYILCWYKEHQKGILINIKENTIKQTATHHFTKYIYKICLCFFVVLNFCNLFFHRYISLCQQTKECLEIFLLLFYHVLVSVLHTRGDIHVRECEDEINQAALSMI